MIYLYPDNVHCYEFKLEDYVSLVSSDSELYYEKELEAEIGSLELRNCYPHGNIWDEDEAKNLEETYKAKYINW